MWSLREHHGEDSDGDDGDDGYYGDNDGDGDDGNVWQLMATFGIWWQLWESDGNFWQLMERCHFWAILAQNPQKWQGALTQPFQMLRRQNDQ